MQQRTRLDGGQSMLETQKCEVIIQIDVGNRCSMEGKENEKEPPNRVSCRARTQAWYNTNTETWQILKK